MTLIFLLFIGMNSCHKYEEDLTIEKIHYAFKINSCKDGLKWIPYGNPDNSEYIAATNFGLLTVDFDKSKFNRQILAVTENGKLIETSVNINSLVIDNANGDIYECNLGSIYTVDKGNYSKTLVVSSEEHISAGNYIVNNGILYLTKRINENKTIEIISYNLMTDEFSILYKDTRQDNRIYSSQLSIRVKNDNSFLSIYSVNGSSNYIHTYSLSDNKVVWEAGLEDISTNLRLPNGNYHVDMEQKTLKTYDIETGKLRFETPLGDYNYRGIIDNHAILSNFETFKLVHLGNGDITHSNDAKIINSFNSTIYSVNENNQFEAFDLETEKNLFCVNLNNIEESENFKRWSLDPHNQHIVGINSSCDRTELLVLQY